MIKKVLTSVIFTLLVSAYAFAQSPTWKEIQANTDKYIYGKGHGATVNEASSMALEELVSQISSNVSSQFDYRSAQTDTGNDADSRVDVRQIINTYSRMTLNNTKILDITSKKGKEKEIVRYITKKDLDEMFAERGRKAENYVNSAIRWERKGNVGTALQYYYWALALVNSYPDGDKLTMIDDNREQRKVYSWIPELMNNAMKKIAVTVTAIDKDEEDKYLTIDVKYDGTPASDLSFTCTDGKFMSNPITCKDGVGEITMPLEAKDKKLTLNIDYRGLNEANRDHELADVVKALTDVTFKFSTISLGREIAKRQQTTFADTKKAEEAAQMIEDAIAKTATAGVAVKEENAKPIPAPEMTKNMVHYLDVNEAAAYIPVAQKIEAALRARKINQLQALCTPEGWKMVQNLLSYGSARLVGFPNIQFLDNDGDIMVRSFPMSFTFKSNNKRKFTEDVVFHLNRDGKITQVAFALEKRAADDILCHKGNWGDQAKQIIVNFVETYKTAFALKDIDYLDKIFSDDALIITGSVVKKSDVPSDMTLRDGTRIKYVQQTKQEYLKNLERTFNSNEYVNLKFADTMVRKGGYKNLKTGKQKEVYGIQLKQDYFSQYYGDTGYLFLAVDLDDPSKPVIHIRTWQPEADTKDSGVFGIEDFQ